MNRKGLINSYLLVVLSMILGTVDYPFAKSKLFEGFGDDFKTNPLWITLFFIFLGLAILGFIVYSRIKKTRLDREVVIKKWLKFGDLVRQRDFNKFEENLLKDMLTLKKIAKVNNVFKSPLLFEKIVDHYLQHKRETNILNAITNIRKKLGYIPLPQNETISSTRQLEPQTLIKCKVSNPYESFVSIVKIENINEVNWEILFQEKIDDRFSKQDDIKIYFNRENDGEYSLGTRILANARSGYSLILDHTTNINRIQLREYVRVNTRLPVEAVVINQSDKPETQKELYKGHALDICGGGIKADMPIGFVEGTQLKLKITWGTNVMEGIKAKVVCAEPWRSESKDSHIVHLKFITINSLDQAKIIRKVYQSDTEVKAH